MARPAMDRSRSRVIAVEIGGQRYPIRSELDEAYVSQLAAYVDERMRLASRETTAGDSMKVAVLAALNIADEYFRCRDLNTANSEIRSRAERIERLVDRILAADRA